MADFLRLECPHCGERAMSCWRKWYLTCLKWDTPESCRICGLQVKVPALRVMGWTGPFILFLLVSNLLFATGVLTGRVGLTVVLPVAGLLAVMGLAGLLFGIPLRMYGFTNSEIVRKAQKRQTVRR